jgi:hypothetical protein
MRRIFGRFGHTCGLSSWQEFVQYAQRNRLQMYIRYTENRSAKIVLTVGKKPLRPYGLGGLYSGTFSVLWMGGGYRMRIVSVFVSVFA